MNSDRSPSVIDQRLALVPLRVLFDWLAVGDPVTSPPPSSGGSPAPKSTTPAPADLQAQAAAQPSGRTARAWTVSHEWTMPRRDIALRRPSFSVSPTPVAAPQTPPPRPDPPPLPPPPFFAAAPAVEQAAEWSPSVAVEPSPAPLPTPDPPRIDEPGPAAAPKAEPKLPTPRRSAVLSRFDALPVHILVFAGISTLIAIAVCAVLLR